MTRHISTADTAKLVRQALKAAFPEVKFSVRSKSYAGGSSIDVSYLDGPRIALVEKICSKFEGASFDGMIDLKSYHESEYNGEQVHFGADYVKPGRNYSEAFLSRVVERFCSYTGYTQPKILLYSDGTAYVERDFSNDLDRELWQLYQDIDAKELDKLEFCISGGRFAVKRADAIQDQEVREPIEDKTLEPIQTEQQVIVTVLEDRGSEKVLRVLSRESATPVRLTIQGELAFYLKRYHAVAVSSETFQIEWEKRLSNVS